MLPPRPWLNPRSRPQISRRVRSSTSRTSSGKGCRRVDALGVEVAEHLGQELVVATVRPVDRVPRREADDRADRAALLADAGVRGSVDEPLGRQLEHELLEGPDEDELAVHRGEQLGRRGVPVGLGHDELGPLDGGLRGGCARASGTPFAIGRAPSLAQYGSNFNRGWTSTRTQCQSEAFRLSDPIGSRPWPIARTHARQPVVEP